MKYQLLMECRAGTRHSWKTTMLVELANGTFQVHKTCLLCKSTKAPVWGSKGQILKNPAYNHSSEYRKFLDSHDPAEARMAIMASDIRKVKAPTDEKNGTVLRLVSKTRTRGGHAHARKRPRDKKRA